MGRSVNLRRGCECVELLGPAITRNFEGHGADATRSCVCRQAHVEQAALGGANLEIGRVVAMSCFSYFETVHPCGNMHHEMAFVRACLSLSIDRDLGVAWLHVEIVEVAANEHVASHGDSRGGCGG